LLPSTAYVADVALAAVDANLPDMRRRLTSASRRGRALASKQLQLLYHTRSEPEAGASTEVSVMAGKCVVCGAACTLCAGQEVMLVAACLAASLKTHTVSRTLRTAQRMDRGARAPMHFIYVL
jgi:hypothetical protein